MFGFIYIIHAYFVHRIFLGFKFSSNIFLPLKFFERCDHATTKGSKYIVPGGFVFYVKSQSLEKCCLQIQGFWCPEICTVIPIYCGVQQAWNDTQTTGFTPGFGLGAPSKVSH